MLFLYRIAYFLGLVSKEQWLDHKLRRCDQLMWRYHQGKKVRLRPADHILNWALVIALSSLFIAACGMF